MNALLCSPMINGPDNCFLSSTGQGPVFLTVLHGEIGRGGGGEQSLSPLLLYLSLGGFSGTSGPGPAETSRLLGLVSISFSFFHSFEIFDFWTLRL